MAETMICCICLTTNGRLANIFQYNLHTTYFNLTGIQISQDSIYLHHICSYCSRLLAKSAAFKDKCERSIELIEYAIRKNKTISQNFLHTLKKEKHWLSFSVVTNTDLSTVSETETKTDIKVEVDDFDNFDNDIDNDVDTQDREWENYSDDEPLAKKKNQQVKPRKRASTKQLRPKKPVVKEKVVLNNIVDDIDNDSRDSFKWENYSDEETLGNLAKKVDDFKRDRNAGKRKKEKIIDKSGTMNDFDCVIVNLTKEQQRAEVESRRNTQNYINSLFKCDKCYKGFMMDSTFNNHMKKHSPESGDYSCEVCLTRWPDKKTLKSHSIVHERQYICKLCKNISRTSYKAKEHRYWHTGMTYDCQFCGTSFNKSTTLLTHIRLNHPSKYSCEFCGESFIGEYGLRMHRMKVHKDTIENAAVVKDDFPCENCSVPFKNKKALEKHLSYDNCKTSSSCLVCGESFALDAELKEHLKTHKRNESVKCDQCNSILANQKSLALHLQRVHMGVKDSRRREPGGVVCEICGVTCVTKSTLMFHQRRHTGEKPHQCSDCPKSFSTLQRLQIHIRTHTGERPFKCIQCIKAFKHKAALNRHVRVHTGLKPYECQHCGKLFSQSNSMKVHIRTVHLKIPSQYRNKKRVETL